MPRFCTPADSPLLNEHLALCRIYAEAQERCSRHMAAQRAEVARLQDDVLRLRGQALVLTTALAWERADHAARPPAVAQEEVLPEPVAASLAPSERAPCQRTLLESSLAEANLALCQMGCLSHGAHWRDAHNQCRLTGQTCVVVECEGALQAAAATAMLVAAVPTE